MKMTDFIIGVILAAMFMTAFGLILSDASTSYGIIYSESDMATFDKMQEIQNLTEEIKDEVGNQTTDRSLYDVVGGFFSDAKNTLMLSAKSFTMFESMTSEGMRHMEVPAFFKTVLWAIVIVLLFIGVILAAILGRRL